MHGQRIDQDLSNLGKAVRRSAESRVNEGMARMTSLLLCSAWRQPAPGKALWRGHHNPDRIRVHITKSWKLSEDVVPHPSPH